MQRISLAGAAVLALLVCDVRQAKADINTPAGLLPGDQFRIAFTTLTPTTATSSSISFYDNIVQTDANAAGLGTYNGSPVTWMAIGSTATVSAVSRLPMDNVPIYLPTGTEVAAGGAQLWSSGTTPLLSGIDEYPTGLGPVTQGIFTGTTSDGGIAPGNYLGVGSSDTSYVEDGRSDMTGTGWVALGVTFAVGSENLDGFSQVLTVPEIPEPASLCLLGLGAATLLIRGVKHKQKQP
jgi:hypothetical protein